MTMANRKLQTEIDRCLKKVSEGIDEFNEIFEKIYSTTHSGQKEKYEQDLKKEIKKLQRLRDQIKTWLSSSDIKDKSALMETRRSIESQMERFKACEKEMKLKQFSKEGLLQQDKLDPSQLKKHELCDWITQQVDAIGTQVDALEAEAESLNAQKKLDRSSKERLGKIEHTVGRHKFHQKQLEIVLRMLENDELSAEQVEDNIKEDVEYYIEANQEADFEENEYMYDELNLVEESDMTVLEMAKDVVKEEPSKKKTKEDELLSASAAPVAVAEKEMQSQRDKEAQKEKEKDRKRKEIDDKKRTVEQSDADNAKREKTEFGKLAQSSSTIPSVVGATVTKAGTKMSVPVQIPPAVKAATSQPQPIPGAPKIGKPQTMLQQMQQPQAPPAAVPQRWASPAGTGIGGSDESKTLAAVLAAEKLKRETEIYTPKKEVSPVKASTTSQIRALSPTVSSSTSPAAASPTISPPPGMQPSYAINAGAASIVNTAASGAAAAATISPSSLNDDRMSEAQVLSGLTDLMAIWREAQIKSYGTGDEILRNAQLNSMLDQSLLRRPEPYDSQPTIITTPKTPGNNPQYYPSTLSPAFESSSLFEKLDLDTLFYIFYYQQNSKQQLLAARELKKQSWRFHQKYLTWFQRHEEPKIITDEYEQGTYIYFDYEGAWCQRKKTEFTFEYRYLESEEI